MHDFFINLHIDLYHAQETLLSEHWSHEHTHFDPFCRLYYVAGGNGRLELDKEEFNLGSGDFCLIPSQREIRHLPSPGLHLYWIHFQARILTGMEMFAALDVPFKLRGKEDGSTHRQFRNVIKAYTRSGLADGVACQGELRLLLADFIKAGRLKLANERLEGIARFTPVLEFIEENLDRQILLDELAELLHLNPTYFSNQFAEEFGIPPREYLKRKRIEAAQLMLWHTDEPLKSIAMRIGYGDVCYFSRIFKATTGLTPGAYRKQREHLQEGSG